MTQAVQRSGPRINFRLTVLFGEGEPGSIGHVKNISMQGAAISCANFVDPKTLLNLRLETTHGPMDMLAEVRWSRRFSLQFSFVDDCEMGVKFIDVDPKFPAYFDEMAAQHIELREDPRFEKVFIITIGDGPELQTLNISRTGMYVMTANPPAVGSVIEVRLVLLGLNATVAIEGEVMHAVDISQSYDQHIKPGFGLKFTRFPGEGETVFHEYIDWLTATLTGGKTDGAS